MIYMYYQEYIIWYYINMYTCTCRLCVHVPYLLYSLLLPLIAVAEEIAKYPILSYNDNDDDNTNTNNNSNIV